MLSLHFSQCLKVLAMRFIGFCSHLLTLNQITMKLQKFTLLVLSFMGIASWGFAQDAMTTATTTTSTEVKEEAPAEEEETAKTFEISGFVDAYYAYSPTENPLMTSFTETNNSFSLGMANVVFSKEGKVGFVADLAVGPRAEVANGYTGTTLAAIKQLFVTYTPIEWLTFTLGNFGTHVGYEVIDAPANINYSTSYMFSNGPFYHTGLKADIAFTDNIGFMIGLLDDTDSKFDIVPGKHVGAQLSYSDDKAGVFLNYLGGQEFEGDEFVPKIVSHQIDLTATFQATDQVGLGINATNKSFVPEDGESASWFGAALYANYAFSDAFLLGLRGEYIGDGDGIILGPIDGSVFAFTISGNYSVGPLTIIPEFRIDSANEEVFPDGDDGKFTKSLPVFLVAAVYSF